MKKHPVDDLFSRKLRDAEITPREEAYQKLQERMQSKKRRLGWWQQGPWLAAAGVSLLLIAGWLVWTNTNSEDTLTAQAKPTIESIAKQKSAQLAKSNAVEEKSTDRKEIVNQQISPEKQIAANESVTTVQKSSKIESSLPVLKSEEKQVAQVTEPTKNDKVQDVIIAHESPKAVAQTTITNTESKPTEKTVVLQLPELQQSLLAANEKVPVEKEISTASVESKNSKFDENILNQPRKSTRMAKVWKQLKNAKNGEKVDWDEVGFNPNKLLAKATGKDF
ncbi:hypothetical protein [Runella sp.]|jgi:hypothetical protein|uniref:hypothetical protein n=1 Tax=Runella sp. TaxID=1960881 RepID=UPI0026237B0E|nr:hypothetical protein [Runella sp.]